MIILAQQSSSDNESMQISVMPIVATSALAMSLIAVSTPMTSSMTPSAQKVSWILMLILSIIIILCCCGFINSFFYNYKKLSSYNIKCIVSHIILIIFLSVINIISHKIATSTLLNTLLIVLQIIIFIISVLYFILGYFNTEISMEDPNIAQFAKEHDRERCTLKMILCPILGALCCAIGGYIMASSIISDIMGVILLFLLFMMLLATILFYILSDKKIYMYLCFVMFIVLILLTIYLPEYMSSISTSSKLLFGILLIALGAIFIILGVLQIIHHWSKHKEISIPNVDVPTISNTSNNKASGGVGD